MEKHLIYKSLYNINYFIIPTSYTYSLRVYSFIIAFDDNESHTHTHTHTLNRTLDEASAHRRGRSN